METPDTFLRAAGAKAKHAVRQMLPARTTPDPYGFRILQHLQDRPLYAGTVPDAEVQRRREANRRARKARRITRRRG